MNALGTEANPLRVAIIGSGPSAFYAAEALLQSPQVVDVDMFERLPVPFGLVRYGVAPDHQKLKEVVNIYTQIAQHRRFALFGNVCIGKRITIDDLKEHYHAVVAACGAAADRRLGIPGEDLPGVHAATDFIGWYNGHPDFRDLRFDLSQEVAVIVGQGNVAIDVCRILSKSVDELRHTDIAEHALDALASSRIREIHLVGRRGPAQAKFTNKELRELGDLAHCNPIVDGSDLLLNEASRVELAHPDRTVNAKNLELFQRFSTRTATSVRTCRLRFLLNPRELQGTTHLERVVFDKTRLVGAPFHQTAEPTGEIVTLNAGLLFRSIGYRGVALDGIPFDESKGVIPNRQGRILSAQGVPLPGLYATGWIKRGPNGIIGTNRADSIATVEALLSDIPVLEMAPLPGRKAMLGLLDARGVRATSFKDWQSIDAAEKERGRVVGKPREKFTRTDEMLSVIGN